MMGNIDALRPFVKRTLMFRLIREQEWEQVMQEWYLQKPDMIIAEIKFGLKWHIQTDATDATWGAIVSVGKTELAWAGKLKYKMGSSYASEAAAMECALRKMIRLARICKPVGVCIKLTHEAKGHPASRSLLNHIEEWKKFTKVSKLAFVPGAENDADSETRGISLAQSRSEAIKKVERRDLLRDAKKKSAYD
eukprot:GHVO01002521.1.p1 GENE.GHVO01002521.1~~GHVO01002521.1.p1  ORF type:complete len:193 (+),score=15.30 GHVO01002521.1:524-1102(+)